jgi:hypothetical protein
MFKGPNLIRSAIALACAIAGVAEAASVLASGPVFGGSSQQQVACAVVNAGNAPIHFISTELLGQYRAPLIQNFNDCTNRPSLLPGATCTFQANVNDQGTAPHQAASCKVVISEPKTNVRGTMVAVDPLQGRPLSETDLR